MPFTLKEHKTLFKLQLVPGRLLCPHSVPLTWMMFPTHKGFSIWIHLQIWPSRYNLSLCQENKSTLKKGNFIHFSSEFPPGHCSLWKKRGCELPRAMGVLGSAEEPSARARFLSGPAAFWAVMLPFLHTAADGSYLSCSLLPFTWGSMHTHICTGHAFAILVLRRMALFSLHKGMLAVLGMSVLQLRVCP